MGLTQEDKQLLLADLSGRLLYDLMVDRLGVPRKVLAIHPYNASLLIDRGEYMPAWYRLDEVKPYLRPMSSMTEEEKKRQKDYIYRFSKNSLPDYEGDFVFENEAHEYIDWLNKKMFDYRGLIEKGLALEAPDGIHNNKEEQQ